MHCIHEHDHTPAYIQQLCALKAKLEVLKKKYEELKEEQQSSEDSQNQDENKDIEDLINALTGDLANQDDLDEIIKIINSKKWLSDIPDYYVTENEVKEILANYYQNHKIDVDLSNYYTKAYIDGIVSKLNSDISSVGSNGYKESDFGYTADSTTSQDSTKYKIGDIKLAGYTYPIYGKDAASSGQSQYILPMATSNTLGGIKIGFQEDGVARNYPVKLMGEKAYVHVPWSSATSESDLSEELTERIEHAQQQINDALDAIESVEKTVNDFQTSTNADLKTLKWYVDNDGFVGPLNRIVAEKTKSGTFASWIQQTARNIDTLVASYDENGDPVAFSRIEQLENKIQLLVDKSTGNVTPASLYLALNDNNQSDIGLKADRIIFDGNSYGKDLTLTGHIIATNLDIIKNVEDVTSGQGFFEGRVSAAGYNVLDKQGQYQYGKTEDVTIGNVTLKFVNGIYIGTSDSASTTGKTQLTPQTGILPTFKMQYKYADSNGFIDTVDHSKEIQCIKYSFENKNNFVVYTAIKYEDGTDTVRQHALNAKTTTEWYSGWQIGGAKTNWRNGVNPQISGGYYYFK